MTDKNIQTLEAQEFGNTKENVLNLSELLNTGRPLNQPTLDNTLNLATTQDRLDFSKLAAAYSEDPALVQVQNRLQPEPPEPKDTLQEFTDLKQHIFKNGKLVPEELDPRREKFRDVISKLKDEFALNTSDFENYLRSDTNLSGTLSEYFSAQKLVHKELDNLEEDDFKKVFHNVKHFFITRNPEERLRILEEIKENPKALGVASALEGFDAVFDKHRNTLIAFDQANGSLFRSFEKTTAVTQNYLDLLKQYQQAKPGAGSEDEIQKLESWLKGFKQQNGYINSLPLNLFNFDYIRKPVLKI